MAASYKDVKERLSAFSNPEKVKILSSFFKSAPGQYGEGDIFWGIPVPVNRNVAKEFRDIPIEDISLLIDDEVHEVRLCGFLILVDKFAKSKNSEKERKEIVDFYLSKAEKANNWDLVDLSCPKILGEWISLERNKRKKENHPEHDKFGSDILTSFSKDENLWRKRIAMVSTWTMMRHGYLDDTFVLALALLNDEHDLIRKAVGWMLREAGKKDEKRLVAFLEEHAHYMPRTTLRYAIEKFDKEKRLYFMNKKKS